MKLWEDFLKKLEKDLGKQTFNKWLKPLQILKFDAGNLHLNATHSFQILWYQEHINEELKNSNGSTIKIHFYLNGKPIDGQIKKSSKEEITKQYFSADHLSSYATFNTFIKDEAPFLPIDLLKHCDSTYNPIFLYGPIGSGKTHLLMAAAHDLKKKGKKVFYVKAETFTEHVIRAFRTNSLLEFRPTYRNLDCLIIDDVERFKRKIATQEELFHTFNRLHIQNVQIILSSSDPPAQLDGIEDRLKSRFEWGISLPISPPTLTEKKQIIQKRAENLSLPLTDLMYAYLLETFQTLPGLVRALEALTLRLHQSHLSYLDIPMINHLLQDLIQEEKSLFLTPEKIVQVVAETFQITTNAILGRSQKKESVLPRKIAMYFFRILLQMPYIKIGDFFSRDHSTVMSSIKQIKKENKLIRIISEIKRKLT